MATVDGVWDCEVKTPLGLKKSEMILRTDGDKLMGENVSPEETVPLLDGKVNGDTLAWRVEMQKPFPMKLDVEVKVSGDTMEGTTSAGFFAKSKLRATRRV
jgi:hypothetical protein